MKFAYKKVAQVAQGALRTGQIISHASSEVAYTVGHKATDIIVNRTPDIYDDVSNDFSVKTTETFIGNATMVGRNIIRGQRSLKYKVLQRNIDKTEVRVHELKEKIEADRKQYNLLAKKDPKSAQKIKEQILQNRKELMDLEYKIKRTRKRVHLERGLDLKRSTKLTIGNQSRKLYLHLMRNDDFGSQVFGKVGMAHRHFRTAKRVVTNTPRIIVSVVKNTFNALIGLGSTIQGLIVMFMTSIPLVAAGSILLVLMFLFSSGLDTSGRVKQFTLNEIRLENAYHTGLIPDEILAITQVLGWTVPDEEDYEILLSLAYGQQRGDKPSFEKMMDNVFRRYNPATHIYIGQNINENADTGFDYYHSNDNVWGGYIQRKNITYEQWLDIYPTYTRASDDMKRKMATTEYINQLKQTCRDYLELNGYNYLASFLTIDDIPNVFTDKIIDANRAYYSSELGYRNITLLDGSSNNNFHRGIDIPATLNTPVYAPCDSIVIYADGSQTKEGEGCGFWNSGNVVILRKDLYDANGEPCYLYIEFAHLAHNSVRVRTGQKVSSGMQLAGVGTTGISTGYHLHFQCWISSKKINPGSGIPYPPVSPGAYTDGDTGAVLSIDTNNYTIIMDGLMFYDSEYRNKIIGR